MGIMQLNPIAQAMKTRYQTVLASFEEGLTISPDNEFYNNLLADKEWPGLDLVMYAGNRSLIYAVVHWLYDYIPAELLNAGLIRYTNPTEALQNIAQMENFTYEDYEMGLYDKSISDLIGVKGGKSPSVWLPVTNENGALLLRSLRTLTTSGPVEVEVEVKAEDAIEGYPPSTMNQYMTQLESLTYWLLYATDFQYTSKVKLPNPDISDVYAIFDSDEVSEKISDHILPEYADLYTNPVRSLELQLFFPLKQYTSTAGEDLTSKHSRIRQAMYIGRIDAQTTATGYVEVAFDYEVAAHVTSDPKVDTVKLFHWCRSNIPKLVMAEYVPNALGSQSANSGDFGLRPYRDLDRIIEDTSSILATKATNDEDLAVDRQGQLRLIPEVVDTKSYKEYYASIGKLKASDGRMQVSLLKQETLAELQENDNYTFREIQSALGKLKTMTNTLIYTDWRLCRIMYANTEGSINLLDINAFRPATATNEVAILKKPISDDFVRSLFTMQGKWCSSIDRTPASFIEPADLEMFVQPEHLEQYRAASTDIKIAADWLANNMNRFFAWHFDRNIDSKSVGGLIEYFTELLLIGSRRFDQLQAAGFTFDFESGEEELKLRSIYDYPCFTFIKRISDTFISEHSPKWKEEMRSLGVRAVIDVIGPYSAVLAKYPSAQVAFEADLASRTQYLEPDLDPNYKPLPIPNISEEEERFFLAHQVKADNHLKNNPTNAVLAVDAGGGKTVLGLVDALRAMQEGKRCLVLSPDNLMSNYVKDAVYLCGGKLNVVAINTQVFNEYGEDGLQRIFDAAPPNTLFMLSFNSLSHGRTINYSYDGNYVKLNEVVEFMRNQRWDRIYVDESHQLSNPKAGRTSTAARLLASANEVRLMTGTFINKDATNALNQSRLLDPGAFGTDDEFIEKYALSGSRSGVSVWKPQATQQIYNHLKGHCDFVEIKRKEWAAWLPERQEDLHIIDMSEAQREMYDLIMAETIEELMSDPKVQEAMKADEDEVNLEGAMKHHLARIERFMTAPDTDALNNVTPLMDDDAVGPKVKKIIEILDSHFGNAETKDSKVLIFTAYKLSAEAIYRNLPPHLQKVALHYTTEQQKELMPRIKKDPNVKIVIGVEDSLNTGHNFQMYSRLIRVESVWNPGTLDQAESRINRPDPKNESGKRSKIFFDWIVVNRSIDITKMSRLIGRLIHSAKFGDSVQFYENLPDLPVIAMSLDNIRSQNDYDSSLRSYAEAYSQFLSVREQDYADYRVKNAHLKPAPMVSSGVMEGSAYMKVPYIPGMALPHQQELGLVALDEHAMDIGVDTITRLTKEHLKGKLVHTEWGEGTVRRVFGETLHIEMPDGSVIKSVPKSQAFLMTKELEGTVDENIRALTQLDGVEIDEYVDDVVEEVQEDVKEAQEEKEERKRNRPIKPQPTVDTEANQEVEMFLSIMNGHLSISVSSEDPDATKRSLAKFGFRETGPYLYAHIPTRKRLVVLQERLNDKFRINDRTNAVLDHIYDSFMQKGRRLNVEQALQVDIKDFYISRRRRVPEGRLDVHPLIEDGELYLCAWLKGQPQAKQLRRLKVPGVKWEADEGFFFQFFKKKSEVTAFIKDFKKNSGLTIGNEDELRETYRIIKPRKPGYFEYDEE